MLIKEIAAGVSIVALGSLVIWGVKKFSKMNKRVGLGLTYLYYSLIGKEWDKRLEKQVLNETKPEKAYYVLMKIIGVIFIIVGFMFISSALLKL